jgi:uncharacterized protein (DUF427 family)
VSCRPTASSTDPHRAHTVPGSDDDQRERSMVQAVWNGEVIADSDDTVVVEGNHYFPRAAVRGDVLRDSSMQSRCPWKGLASYFSLEVAGQTNPDAAWYYPEPSEAATNIKDHIAFWKGVEVR